MLLDKGGAELRRSGKNTPRLPKRRLKPPGDPMESGFDYDQPGVDDTRSHIVVKIAETHDGVECDCIEGEIKEMTLYLGDEITLIHTCHDGRVDKVSATLEAIYATTGSHHANVEVKRA